MIESYVKKIELMDDEERTSVLNNFSKISTIQRGIWFQYLQNPVSEAYNLGFLLKLKSHCSEERFVQSIVTTVSAHPILRSFFYEDRDPENVYIIPLSFHESRIQEIKVFSKEELFSIIREKYSESFNIKKELPIRIIKIKLNTEYYFFFLFHHIVVDGRSLNIFKNDLEKYYNSHSKEYDNDLGYFNYINQENERNANNSLRNDILNEFCSYYGSFEPEVIEWDVPKIYSHNRAFFVTKKFSEEENYSINTVLKKYNCLPFSIFQLCLGLSLYKLKGLKNIAIGTTVENRLKEIYQNSIGLFSNTMVVKTTVSTKHSFDQMLARIDEEFTKLISNPPISYNELVEFLDLPVFRVPFQVVLECQRIGDSPEDFCFEEVAEKEITRSSKFDLSLFVNINENDEYSICFEYNSCKVTSVEIENLWENVREYIARLPELLENKNTITSSKFDNKYKASIACGELNFHNESLESLLKLFKNNFSLAVLGEAPVSFHDLLDKAVRFSDFIEKDDDFHNIIAIDADRTPETLSMFFGAWLAKKKFMAISNTIPLKRKEVMLRDAGINTFYTKGTYPEDFQKHELFELSKKHSDLPLSPGPGYIIFSSGSTGVPKGLAIGENSILNLLYSLNDMMKDDGIHAVSLNADYAFDAFIQQVIQLLLGKSIYILNKEERLDVEKLIIVLNKYKVQQIDCTPSQLRLYFEEKLFQKVQSLKVVLVGGEPLDENLLKLIKEIPDRKFINVYGPCEATVDVSFKIIGHDTNSNNIGKPIFNTRIYILGKNKEILDVGQIGEITIQGDAVGEGYITAIEGKREGFCKLDLGAGLQSTYLTGDLGYLENSGEIIIKGRVDSQIKKNGVRIELGELESLSKKILAIENAKSYFLKNKIILFIQTKNGQITSKVVRHSLEENLPSYMLPDEIIIVEQFFLNASGKIDCERMYSQRPPDEIIVDNDEKKLLSKKEVQVAEIWSKCIGIDSSVIKEDSNFFSVGGNSLLAFKALKEMRKIFDSDISISHLLNRSSLKEITRKILEKNHEEVGSHSKNIFSINNPLNKKHQIILFHPVGGGVSCYKELAGYLEKYDVESIAIQDSIDSQSGSFSSLTNYAEYIADLILPAYNNAHLLGWSFGGLLAFSVSLALQRKSCDVKSLTMIDTYFNEKTSKIHNDDFGLQSVLNHIFFENQQPLKEISLILGDTNFSKNSSNKVKIVYDFLKESHLKNFHIEFSDFERIVEIANHHRKLVGTLDLNISVKLKTQVKLIYADQSLNDLRSNLFDWQKFVIKPVEEYQIAGDHYSIIKNADTFFRVSAIVRGEENV